MPKKHNPRRGSLQFWPRVRAKRQHARLPASVNSKESGLIGFAGYKVGMTHVIMTDNRAKATTKGEDVACAVTIVECPPMKIASVRFYKDEGAYGSRVVSEVQNPKLDRELSRLISLPKKDAKKLDEVSLDNVDEIRVNVYTQPKKTVIGKKKPELFEMRLGGSKDDQLAWVKENLDKELTVSDTIKEGQQYDAHSVTRGKGFQGATKRFGLMIKSHKSEKKRRAPGNLGPWHPAKISFRVPQPGQMGYHTRTEYNKWILRVSNNPSEINREAGFRAYGVVKNDYILLKGSVSGPAKRLIKFTQALKPNAKIPKEAPSMSYVAAEPQAKEAAQ